MWVNGTVTHAGCGLPQNSCILPFLFFEMAKKSNWAALPGHTVARHSWIFVGDEFHGGITLFTRRSAYWLQVQFCTTGRVYGTPHWKAPRTQRTPICFPFSSPKSFWLGAAHASDHLRLTFRSLQTEHGVNLALGWSAWAPLIMMQLGLKSCFCNTPIIASGTE